ncbi:GNAT family N-acetyltransferase [Carboxylicivirga linearis]|uniref:GNAT family N-acetyltransferase n=1 Tax=Carboxylicivirga linearis TaxID=1628157 RepID=A0ABS5JT89_9BACT|nr:GNAT family N-acetyltransferase [Carboxylicivirga linearis]MBS2097749.1 GNAT family N-acetyltransferase [Carboxylicivirga linearis]
MQIKRTHAEDPDFIELVRLLDADLAKRDGDEHAFYAQYNKIDNLKYVVVIVDKDKPISCGAIKHYDEISMELKRMFTLPTVRGKGVASLVLQELEIWTTQLGYSRCILETGIRQPEAIALYNKNGYSLIPNYGPYINVEDSRCFMKEVK